MTATAVPGLQFPGHILSIDLGGAVRTEGRGTIGPFSSVHGRRESIYQRTVQTKAKACQRAESLAAE